MKTYLHFLLEVAEKEIDQFKTDITNQILNRDAGQKPGEKEEFAEDSEKSPDPDVVMYMDKEQEGIQKKIEELETQKQGIQKKIKAIEDMVVDQTVDPNNEDTMKKIENMKKQLTQDIERFDSLIKMEQDKQNLLKEREK